MSFDKKLLYIDENGLHVPIKTEIKESLRKMTIEAFGTEFVYDEGSEWDVFLDLLSDCLKTFSDSCRDVFSSIGINTARGVALDNLVSLGGIQRKKYEDETVETDAQLRRRYADSLYYSSSSVKGGLTSKLLGLEGITYANVIENDTASEINIKLNQNVGVSNDEYNSSIAPHSILIVVYGENINTELVAKTIANNKVLGCGTVGAIQVQKDYDSDGIVENINFSVAQDVEVEFTITLKDKTGSLNSVVKESIIQELSELVINKINSVQPFNNILYYDILGCLFEIYSNKNIDSKTLIISSVVAYKQGNMVGFDASNDIEIFADEKAVPNINKIIVKFE